MTDILTLPTIVSETKRSLKIALPLIASEIIFALSGFFSTVMIADLGKESLAAHSLAWSIYFPVILFAIGIIFSVSILISQSFGANDHRSIGLCFNQGLLLASILSPIIMVIIWFCPIILTWTNQDLVIIDMAEKALHALAWTIFPLNIMVALHHFLMGIGKTYIVTVMSILAVPIEIFFIYGFIFGKFGLPQLALSSIGYGLTASYSIITIPFLAYALLSGKFSLYRTNKPWWKIDFKIFFELTKLGLPLGFMFTLESALLAVVAIMMGKLGTNTLAAYQISYQYLMVALVILFALIQSITVIVGIEVGRNNRAALRLATAVSLVFGLSIMALFSLFYVSFPELAIGLDFDVTAANTREVVEKASKFLSAVGALLIIDCIRLISTGALRGMKDTKIPLLLSFIGFWCIAFPCAYLLGFYFEFGEMGIWYGILIGLSFSALTLLYRFNNLSKHIDLGSMVTKTAEK